MVGFGIGAGVEAAFSSKQQWGGCQGAGELLEGGRFELPVSGGSAWDLQEHGAAKLALQDALQSS